MWWPGKKRAELADAVIEKTSGSMTRLSDGAKVRARCVYQIKVVAGEAISRYTTITG